MHNATSTSFRRTQQLLLDSIAKTILGNKVQSIIQIGFHHHHPITTLCVKLLLLVAPDVHAS